MATINFQERVIEKSFETPVVVDFWAAWCGPCRVLGPVITEMSKEAGGQWELVKVDTEANQEIAQDYQVMSIPNVKMFHKGEVIAEFAGALPRHQIAKWLEENLPNPEKEAVQELIQSVLQTPTPEAVESLKAHSNIPEAQLYYHWLTAIHHPEQSLQWLQQQGASEKYFEQIKDIRAVVEFAEKEAEGSEGFVKAYEAAKNGLRALDLDMALKELVQTVMLNKNFSNELPRRLMISMFHLLGEGHELTKKYRPLFSMALY